MYPLLLLSLAQAAQVPESSREERVLALLSEVHRFGSYRYSNTVFESVPAPLGDGPVIVPRIDVFCGNSDDGTFDDTYVRRGALELSKIYGLAAEAGWHAAEGEMSVVLDGLDPSAGIGFELRGLGCRETFCEIVAEDPAAALDEAEFAWLSARGIRLHVADVAEYRGYGDDFTPALAYLAGLVRFLNEVTEGEDVELGGLLFEREKAWKMPPVRVDGVSVIDAGFGPELHVDRDVTLVFSCRGLSDFETAPDRDILGFYGTPEERAVRRTLTATRGAPSVLYLPIEARRKSPEDPEPEVRLRVRQWGKETEMTHESRSLAAFLPGSFELADPFVMELDLPPGEYCSYGSLRIGAAAPRR